ncbi:MAG: PIN domain nuclease [Hyphomicrobiales bacterium]|jgi:predicted nucleic acid-binding protein|nr:PIN domain nuclease [Hyphomicrobiales bacterium]
MIIVDSSVWIDYFRGIENDHVSHLRDRSPDDVIVGDLILMELLQGARDDKHAARIASHLGEFVVVSLCGPQLAVAAARNYRYLRAKGITIRRTIDVIIATYCIEHGYLLLHRDRDFSPFAQHLGLELAHAAQ